MRTLLLVAAALSLAVAARADRALEPAGPPLPATAPEQPCDPDAPVGAQGPLVARYMCQIGLDGVWGSPYPCEIARPAKRSGYLGYLRYTRFDIKCDVVGTLAGSARTFDGSMSCIPDQPDVIGKDALFDGRLRSVAGGFRLDAAIDVVIETALGSEDDMPRKTREDTVRTQLSLNVCRRAWPKGFVSDVERTKQGD